MASAKIYDVVLFGATGFTGELTAEYLAKVSLKENFRWAIAGRNLEKLERLRKRLSSFNPDLRQGLGLIRADVDDPHSLDTLASLAKVVITTVGPYIHFGEPVLRACIEHNADYLDLTGEPEYVDAMMARYGALAKKKQVRVVNSCGFDSIPHDLGAFYTVQVLTKGLTRLEASREVIKLEGFVRAGGTFSGGTWHSTVHAFSRFRNFRRLRQRKSTKSRSSRVVKAAPPSLRFRQELASWACPFPTIDPQVVRRSAKFMDDYGKNFEYGHYVQVKRLPKLVMGAATVGSVFALSQFGPTRNWLLSLKPSGEGPNRHQMEKGWFKVTFIGEGLHRKVMTQVSGGDPGYGETSKMLAESALCLALDRRRLPKRHGFLTPAAGLGKPLLERLQKAGIRFEVLSDKHT